MTVLLIISALAVISTKFADCYTTDIRITQETINMEKNKIGRWLFHKFGARKAIWATWILAIVISVVMIIDAHNEPMWYQVLVISTASFVAFVQGAVAHANHTQTPNIVTQFISRFRLYS